MQIVWQRANKLEFNYKLIFKECFMLMICIQVTNAMKDDIAPVIYKEMEPVWGEMFMAGSGQKSEANETEIKHMRRHKRLMLLVDWKLTGKAWHGYTDWTNTGSFLMDCRMSPQQRLMTSPFHWHQPLVPRCPTGGHELNPCTCLPGHPPALLWRVHHWCHDLVLWNADTLPDTEANTARCEKSFLGPGGSSSSNKEQHTGKTCRRGYPITDEK